MITKNANTATDALSADDAKNITYYFTCYT